MCPIKYSKENQIVKTSKMNHKNIKNLSIRIWFYYQLLNIYKNSIHIWNRAMWMRNCERSSTPNMSHIHYHNLFYYRKMKKIHCTEISNVKYATHSATGVAHGKKLSKLFCTVMRRHQRNITIQQNGLSNVPSTMCVYSRYNYSKNNDIFIN